MSDNGNNSNTDMVTMFRVGKDTVCFSKGISSPIYGQEIIGDRKITFTPCKIPFENIPASPPQSKVLSSSSDQINVSPMKDTSGEVGNLLAKYNKAILLSKRHPIRRKNSLVLSGRRRKQSMHISNLLDRVAEVANSPIKSPVISPLRGGGRYGSAPHTGLLSPTADAFNNGPSGASIDISVTNSNISSSTTEEVIASIRARQQERKEHLSPIRAANNAHTLKQQREIESARTRAHAAALAQALAAEKNYSVLMGALKGEGEGEGDKQQQHCNKGQEQSWGQEQAVNVNLNMPCALLSGIGNGGSGSDRGVHDHYVSLLDPTPVKSERASVAVVGVTRTNGGITSSSTNSSSHPLSAGGSSNGHDKGCEGSTSTTGSGAVVFRAGADADAAGAARLCPLTPGDIRLYTNANNNIQQRHRQLLTPTQSSSNRESEGDNDDGNSSGGGDLCQPSVYISSSTPEALSPTVTSTIDAVTAAVVPANASPLMLTPSSDTRVDSAVDDEQIVAVDLTCRYNDADDADDEVENDDADASPFEFNETPVKVKVKQIESAAITRTATETATSATTSPATAAAVATTPPFTASPAAAVATTPPFTASPAAAVAITRPNFDPSPSFSPRIAPAKSHPVLSKPPRSAVRTTVMQSAVQSVVAAAAAAAAMVKITAATTPSKRSIYKSASKHTDPAATAATTPLRPAALRLRIIGTESEKATVTAATASTVVPTPPPRTINANTNADTCTPSKTPVGAKTPTGAAPRTLITRTPAGASSSVVSRSGVGVHSAVRARTAVKATPTPVTPTPTPKFKQPLTPVTRTPRPMAVSVRELMGKTPRAKSAALTVAGSSSTGGKVAGTSVNAAPAAVGAADITVSAVTTTAVTTVGTGINCSSPKSPYRSPLRPAVTPSATAPATATASAVKKTLQLQSVRHTPSKASMTTTATTGPRTPSRRPDVDAGAGVVSSGCGYGRNSARPTPTTACSSHRPHNLDLGVVDRVLGRGSFSGSAARKHTGHQQQLVTSTSSAIATNSSSSSSKTPVAGGSHMGPATATKRTPLSSITHKVNTARKHLLQGQGQGGREEATATLTINSVKVLSPAPTPVPSLAAADRLLEEWAIASSGCFGDGPDVDCNDDDGGGIGANTDHSNSNTKLSPTGGLLTTSTSVRTTVGFPPSPNSTSNSKHSRNNSNSNSCCGLKDADLLSSCTDLLEEINDLVAENDENISKNDSFLNNLILKAANRRSVRNSSGSGSGSGSARSSFGQNQGQVHDLGQKTGAQGTPAVGEISLSPVVALELTAASPISAIAYAAAAPPLPLPTATPAPASTSVVIDENTAPQTANVANEAGHSWQTQKQNLSLSPKYHHHFNQNEKLEHEQQSYQQQEQRQQYQILEDPWDQL